MGWRRVPPRICLAEVRLDAVDPSGLSNQPNASGLAGCLCRGNFSASCVVLLRVRHGVDVGSPRVAGSTNRRRASASSEVSASVARGRPPSATLSRVSSDASGCSLRAVSFDKPCLIRARRHPGRTADGTDPALAIRFASAAARGWRIQSSSGGAKATYLASIAGMTVAFRITVLEQQTKQASICSDVASYPQWPSQAKRTVG